MIPPGVQERRKQQPLYICFTILYTIWNSKETRVLLYKVGKKKIYFTSTITCGKSKTFLLNQNLVNL